jgi:arabinofuranosyltransferase
VLAAAVAALLLAASVWQPNYKSTIDVWHAQVNELADTGAWVRDTLPSGTTIATFANGALSYEAGTGITVVDLLGLTDEHIAREGKRDSSMMIGHQAQDYDYVLNDRRPSVVFTSGNGYATNPACAVGPLYADKYRGALFQVVGQQRWVTVLLRKDDADDLADRMDADPNYLMERWCD